MFFLVTMISQLIKSKMRNLQILVKCFGGTTTFASNLLLLSDILPVVLVFYSKDLLIWCLDVNYPIISSIVVFIDIIVHFIFITTPQTSWCNGIIVTMFSQIINEHNNIKIFSIVYEYFIDFWCAWPKWDLIFQDSFLFLVLALLVSLTLISPFTKM